MHFAFQQEQELARDALRKLLHDNCTPEQVRASWEADDGSIPGLWEQLAAMGIVGMTAPDRCGGMGSTPLDWILLFEELGRAVAPVPLIEHTVAALPLLAELSASDFDHWLEPAARGEFLIITGLHEDRLVLDAEFADLLLMRSGDELHALPPSAAELTPQPSVVGNRKLSRVRFTPTAETRIASGPTATTTLANAQDRTTLATTAYLLGAGTAMLERSIDYVKLRTQFGSPIGSFQAVKHQLADAWMALEFARPLAYRAAWSLSEGDPEASIHISMAMAAGSDAAQQASTTALQVHGAMGYSYEYDLHLWMKVVWALGASCGDASEHRRRIVA